MKSDDPAPAWAYVVDDPDAEDERRENAPKFRVEFSIFAVLVAGVVVGTGAIAWQLIKALR